MASNYQFAKPESALRKANELIAVGKSEAALKTLHDVLMQRKNRTWSDVYEPFALKYVELAVSLRMNIKEGLHQFRSLCQLNTQFNALESVLRFYVKESEQMLIQAGAKAGQQALESVADLDEEDAPEMLLQRLTSGSEQRSDRELLTPCLKYVWETFRCTLDLLKNNARMDDLYQEIGRMAFAFCLRNRRTAEFRRLTELLRSHLISAQKYQQQVNATNLRASETVQGFLETRFEQLRVAYELELWQEAYRSIEDIHGLVQLSKKTPKAHLMASYFEKLAHIFHLSGNQMFHAYALFRFYTFSLLSGPTQTSPAADRTQLANRLLLAALVIPQRSAVAGDEVEEINDQKNLRMANLLGFVQLPSRARLLRELLDTYDILNEVSPSVRALYELLEVSVAPLELTAAVKPLLTQLEQESSSNSKVSTCADFIPALNRLVVLRLLTQLSSVYRVMKIEKFLQLAPVGLTLVSLQDLIVSALKNRESLSVRLCHKQQLLHFTSADAHGVQQLTAFSERVAHIDSKIQALLHPEQAAAKQAARARMFADINAALEVEHNGVFERQQLIEHRKQEAERRELERAAQRRAEAEAAHAAALKAEQDRLEAEQAAREKEKAEQAEREALIAESAKLVAELTKKLAEAEARGSVIAPRLSELLKNHTEKPMPQSQLKHALNLALDDERRDKEKKNREDFRRTDHFVRACRNEERELLIEAFRAEQEHEVESRRAQNEKLLKESREKHDAAVLDRQRLLRLQPHADVFRQKLMVAREAAFAQQKQQRAIQLAEREAARQKQLEREAAERQAREALLAQQQAAAAEAKRVAEEQASARRAEEAERSAKLSASMELQRKKEAEIEARLAAQRGPRPVGMGGPIGMGGPPATGRVPFAGFGSTRAASEPVSAPSAAPAESSGGGWRSRTAGASSSDAPAAAPTEAWRSARTTSAPAESAPAEAPQRRRIFNSKLQQ